MQSKMKFRTCFSSISYYGYKLDVLKSAFFVLRLNSDIRAYWDHRFRFDGQVYKTDDLNIVDDEYIYKKFVEEPYFKLLFIIRRSNSGGSSILIVNLWCL